MKQIFYTLLFSAFVLSSYAQAPKWFKKARKIQVTLFTYDKDNNMRQGQGYFVSDDGTLLAEYDIFKGAVRATAVDTENNQYDIEEVLGANSIYNIIKVRAHVDKKKPTFVPAATSVTNGSIVYIMPTNTSDKKAICTTDTISQLQQFNEQYNYLTLTTPQNDRLSGCPVLNEEGELVGQVQLNATNKQAAAYVLDTRYGLSLSVTALDANNADLRNVSILKALPDDESQATSYMFLLGNKSDDIYLTYCDKYIAKFPQSAYGYTQKSEAQANRELYADAVATLKDALKANLNAPDEIHYALSKIYYNLCVQNMQEKLPEATLENALAAVNEAYAKNPLPIYTAMQGYCLYSLKQYAEARDKYLSLSQTNMRSTENFLLAAQSHRMAGGSNEEILALQDSAVNMLDKPYGPEAANVIITRATTLQEMERWREAINDYNEYEKIMRKQLTAQFYYKREQMEMKCRQLQQALNDIEQAVSMEPEEPLYRAEQAVVCYRCGFLDEAIAACQEAIRLESSFPDPYRLMGICYREQNNKAKARECLQKAIELGDTIAPGILESLDK